MPHTIPRSDTTPERRLRFLALPPCPSLIPKPDPLVRSRLHTLARGLPDKPGAPNGKTVPRWAKTSTVKADSVPNRT